MIYHIRRVNRIMTIKHIDGKANATRQQCDLAERSVFMEGFRQQFCMKHYKYRMEMETHVDLLHD